MNSSSGSALARRDDAEIVQVERARHLVAVAVIDGDIDGLLELRNRADAIGLYHRRGDAKRAADDAGEVKVRAERGLGQIDRAVRPHGGRRQRDQVQRGMNLPVNPNTRAAWRKLAELDDETFDKYVEIARGDEEAGVSTAKLVEMARTGDLSRLGGFMSSTTFEVYTPSRYVEAARRVLGGIDLDPASCAEANETVKAARFYTADDDGLAHDWPGRIWLNPPYGRTLTGAFVAKLVEEFHAGRTVAAVVLLNAYGFDALWFRPLFEYVMCFTDHRIPFYGAGPTVGSLFVYLGPAEERFAQLFAQFGHILTAWPGSAGGEQCSTPRGVCG